MSMEDSAAPGPIIFVGIMSKHEGSLDATLSSLYVYAYYGLTGLTGVGPPHSRIQTMAAPAAADAMIRMINPFLLLFSSPLVVAAGFGP